MKRAFDIVVSLGVVILLTLPMLAIAFAIWKHDRSPVFYRQTRVGRGTRTFEMLKFRTMVIDADKIGGYQTNTDDARITRVGGFLRRSSLDELPQILNILRGEMSLVGPRPDVPKQESLYAPEDWQKRHYVCPGITGLAQASGRSAMDFETRTRLDLEYADSASLWMDVVIIFRTVAVVFRGV
jgi:lipopolysaccharide/colanic/teichoic acid biosynthesis glycosyltransferase